MNMKERWKVLHIIPSLFRAGAEMLVSELALRMDKTRFEVAVCTLYRPLPGDLSSEILRAKIRFYHLDYGLGLKPGAIRTIASIVNEYRPHVIHTHLGALKYALIPALAFRVPARVHTVHSPVEREDSFIEMIINFVAYHWACVVPVGVSDHVAMTVNQRYRLTDDRVIRIYNGAHVQRFLDHGQVNKESLREMYGLPPKASIVINIGRLEPPKNQYLLLQSAQLVAAAVPEVVFLFCGQGSLLPALQRSVRHLGLEDKAFFLGERADVDKLLLLADVFAITSNWEGFGISIVEAMAAGLPTIATAVGGIPEIIEDGVTGELVQPGNYEVFANVLIQLLRDQSRKHRMGLAAREAAKRFDIHTMVQAYEGLYSALLERVKRNNSSLDWAQG